MHVIGHQHERVDFAVMSSRGVAQPCPIDTTVIVVDEAALPIVPAYDDVLRDTG
jgi:hypothetical protein